MVLKIYVPDWLKPLWFQLLLFLIGIQKVLKSQRINEHVSDELLRKNCSRRSSYFPNYGMGRFKPFWIIFLRVVEQRWETSGTDQLSTETYRWNYRLWAQKKAGKTCQSGLTPKTCDQVVGYRQKNKGMSSSPLARPSLAILKVALFHSEWEQIWFPEIAINDTFCEKAANDERWWKCCATFSSR